MTSISKCPDFRRHSDLELLHALQLQSIKMGLLLSILLLYYVPPAVVFYKCPPLDSDTSDLFLFEEDPFVFYSTPNAVIITIEESDY